LRSTTSSSKHAPDLVTQLVGVGVDATGLEPGADVLAVAAEEVEAAPEEVVAEKPRKKKEKQSKEK